MGIEITKDSIIRLFFRRGAEAERQRIVLGIGEPGYTIDTKTVIVGDGTTVGGNKVPNTDNSTIEWAGSTPDNIRVKDQGITNSKLASVSGNTVKGNNTASTGSPTDISISTNSLVGRLDTVNSGNLSPITISQLFGSIFSPVAPSPVISLYWFNTTLYKWFISDGVNFLSKHYYTANGPERFLYTGSEASLTTYDGGNTSVSSVSSGPMWQIDSTFSGRFPVGVGTLPSGTVINVTGTGGEEQVTLNSTQVPVVEHFHGIGVGINTPSTGGTNDDFAFVMRNWTATSGTPYTMDTCQGAGGSGSYPIPYSTTATSGSASTTNNIQTGTSSSALSGHDNMPPYVGVYVIKRTGRVYYAV